MAKFGIALEWGSRGLEFESRHSDHMSRSSFHCFCSYFLCGEIRTVKCSCPVDNCLMWARPHQHLCVPNLDTRTKSRNSFHCFCFFLFNEEIPTTIKRCFCRSPLLFPPIPLGFDTINPIKYAQADNTPWLRHCQSAVPILPWDGALLFIPPVSAAFVHSGVLHPND